MSMKIERINCRLLERISTIRNLEFGVAAWLGAFHSWIQNFHRISFGFGCFYFCGLYEFNQNLLTIRGNYESQENSLINKSQQMRTWKYRSLRFHSQRFFTLFFFLSFLVTCFLFFVFVSNIDSYLFKGVSHALLAFFFVF